METGSHKANWYFVLKYEVDLWLTVWFIASSQYNSWNANLHNLPFQTVLIGILWAIVKAAEQKMSGRDLWSPAVRVGTLGSKSHDPACFPSISLEKPLHCVKSFLNQKLCSMLKREAITVSLLMPYPAGPGSAWHMLSSLKSPSAKHE